MTGIHKGGIARVCGSALCGAFRAGLFFVFDLRQPLTGVQHDGEGSGIALANQPLQLIVGCRGLLPEWDPIRFRIQIFTDPVQVGQADGGDAPLQLAQMAGLMPMRSASFSWDRHAALRACARRMSICLNEDSFMRFTSRDNAVPSFYAENRKSDKFV